MSKDCDTTEDKLERRRVKVSLCVTLLAIILGSYVLTGVDIDLGIVTRCAQFLQYNIEAQGELVFRWLTSAKHARWGIVYVEIAATKSLHHLNRTLLQQLVLCNNDRDPYLVNITWAAEAVNSTAAGDTTCDPTCVNQTILPNLTLTYRPSPIAAILAILISRVSPTSNHSNKGVVARLMSFSRACVRVVKEVWGDGEILVTLVGSELAAVTAPVLEHISDFISAIADQPYSEPFNTVVKATRGLSTYFDWLSSHLRVAMKMACDGVLLLHSGLCQLLAKASITQSWYSHLSRQGAQVLGCARILCLRVDVAALIDRKYKVLAGLTVLALEGAMLAAIAKAVNKWM